MGRSQIKLPDHLYISPPSPQPSSSFAIASSLFTLKSGLSHSTTPSFLQATSSRAIERRIPGFSTSAAFLTALRANIDLQFDTPDSPVNTPDSLRPTHLSSSVSSLPPPSPPVRAMPAPDSYTDADLAPPSALKLPEANTVDIEQDINAEAEVTKDPNAVPELTSFAASDDVVRTEALRLIADSVAQQRQRASRVLVFHPVTLGLLAVALGLLRQYFSRGSTSDWALIGTTFAGIVMTALVSIRSATGPYIEEAERVGTWRWLSQGRSLDAEKETGKRILGDANDEIIVTKFGDEYIGAIIFRGIQSVDEASATSKKSSKKINTASQPRTEIRGWSVRQRYRGNGVGTALLEDAIKTANDKGWAAGGIEIAPDHANSKVVLPKLFNGFLNQNNEKSTRYVEKKVQEFEESKTSGKGKRRR